MQPGYAVGDDPEPTEAGTARRSIPGADRDDAGRRAPRLHGMDSAQDTATAARTAPADAGGTTAGPTMEPTTGPTQAAGDGHRPAGRTIAGTDAPPVRGAHRAAQRTHSPSPSGLPRTHQYTYHFNDATPAARTGTAQQQTGEKRLYTVTFESMSTFARLTHHRQKMKHSKAPVNVKYFKKYRLMS